MSLTENWLKQLESYCEENEKVFITDAEFQKQIHTLVSEPHSPLLKFDYQINQKEPFTVFSIGVASEDEPTYLGTLEGIDNHRSSCRVRMWKKLGVCVFRAIVGTDSGASWAVIPDHRGHRFRCIVGSSRL